MVIYEKESTFVSIYQSTLMIQLNNGNKKILQIAIPSIVSNITVPLLGLIDVTIVGHLGSAAYIGAIAVGGMLFNIIYWIFGFLRMGTSGMTSQAYGRHDLNEVTRLLLRSVGVGLFIAFTLLALQYPIERIAFTFIQTTEEVEHLAGLYFRICIWGAPAVLGLYSFAGWYIGMQNSRFPMYIAITQNIVNIAVSLLLVYGLGMKIEGVAIGTLTAQYAGLVMAYLLWLRYYSTLRKRIEWHSFFDKQAMYRFFQVNRDIFFRTICLVAVTVFFTSAGAAQGEVVLAVNTLLMQLFTLFSYIMDGFAYAGEALTGRYIGANNQKALHTTVRQLFGWGLGLSLSFTLLYSIGGQSFLGLLTNETTVIHASESYFYWVLAIPLAGFSAFLFDGIFIGATATHLMLKAMIAASVSFFLIYYGFRGAMGNHALWMAFITYLLLRGVMQGVMGRNILGYKTSKKDEQGNIVRNPKGHYVLAADYFNYSCAAGIKYTVDVSRQPGNRVEIHSLSDGRPFHADSTYTVAINSYRGNGGGGHLTQGVGWTKADINQRILKIWDKDVRYYITEYIKEKKVLTPRCRNDWKVIPEAWFQAGKKRDYKIMYESH